MSRFELDCSCVFVVNDFMDLMLNHFLNPICGKNNNHFE